MPLVIAALLAGCATRQARPRPPEQLPSPSETPPSAASASATSRGPSVAPGTLSATTMVRLQVINFTSDSAPFIFRLGGVQLLDTTAAPGTLNVPVLTSTFKVGRGNYGVQVMDRRSGQVLEAPLEMGAVQGTDFATIEIIIEKDSSRLTFCHCVRLYGGGGGMATSSRKLFDGMTAAR